MLPPKWMNKPSSSHMHNQSNWWSLCVCWTYCERVGAVGACVDQLSSAVEPLQPAVGVLLGQVKLRELRATPTDLNDEQNVYTTCNISSSGVIPWGEGAIAPPQ